MMGSWKGTGNQYIQLVKVLYCKLPTNGKRLPVFPFEVEQGSEHDTSCMASSVSFMCIDHYM